MEFYKLRIVNCYLEIDFEDGSYVHVSLAYFPGTIYATPELTRIVNEYNDFRESPWDFPDMVWDPTADTWRYVNTITDKTLKSIELDKFIKQCRRNQNVS
ncbi:hypothetical protein CPT_CIP9_242 [Enterobacter phage vB_EclM_CIP9]|uniref:Uncharacterized protein n=1 Tax=Enterobacter phage vB_EclM_CIP9 TaxID=2696340 RepID=A0A6B9Y0Z9_9CAUD|nr:hypothetical protein HWD05_gp242 [Enterobacter phage vB_EclM_CIP9]QHS01778.1 hypothetical protein CPT_CIP9_242 [Enterobacter phage vB_EclM_CIP9]